MKMFYAGFNASTLFSGTEDPVTKVDFFTEIPLSEIDDIELGWGYFLFWQNNQLFCTVNYQNDARNKKSQIIQIPGKSAESCEIAAAGRKSIIILSTDGDIFQYQHHNDIWKKVPQFISRDVDAKNEFPVKILQEGCTVVLTNLGRVFNIPTLVDVPKRVKFVDIACGFDHTILLADNGDVYSMGMGTRGQLGHSDLEDCDNPKLIEALAGIRVKEISAGGWHSAVITDQGDLYTWGWNTNGELGVLSENTKILALPTLIDFKDENNENAEVFVKQVRCGNNFTICRTDDGTLWGCGSNKYGQLGQSIKKFEGSPLFVKLEIPVKPEEIINFKCREWGTVIITN